MAKRKTATKKQPRRDENQSAFDVMQRIIEKTERPTKTTPRRTTR